MHPPPIFRVASMRDSARPSLRPGVFIALLGVSVCGFAPIVRAEPDLAGQYRGRGEGLVTLTVAPPTRDTNGEGYAITVDTAIRNACTGEVAGLARRVGPGRLQLATKDEGADETCTLELTFSPDRRRVRIQETTCSSFHGTACGFAGTLTRR